MQALEALAAPAVRARRMHDPEATRAALRRAGTRLFAEAGFEGAKVERIAAAAGVNKAMINYHFGGKRALYEAILRESFSRLAAEVQVLRDPARPADQALRELIAAVGRTLAREPGLPGMMLHEILAGGGRLDAAAMPHVFSIFATTRELVRRGVRSGRFRRVDPALTHLGIIGSLVFYFATGAFRQRQVAHGQAPAELKRAARPERFIAHLQDLTTRGLAAQPAAARVGR